MTREEAIKILSTRDAHGVLCGYTSGVTEALDMAIEALKEKNQSDSLVRDDAENCKESESKLDLISREDAIKNAHFQMIDDAGYEVVRVDDILALPSAEPKTGEWIPVSEKPKDEERTYLVQLDSGGMCSCRWTNANPVWTELTIDWHWNIFDIPQYCKVVAWMDLEPYREDGEA